jgi:hypothetical protein
MSGDGVFGGGTEPIRPQGVGRIVLPILLGLALSVAVWLLIQRRGPGTNAVSAAARRFALGLDDRGTVTEVTREAQPDVYYHVTLADAPVGRELSLDCEWRDPSGRPARENHYQTKTISTARWNTHCHQRFGPEAAAGLWTVRLTLEGRTLSSDTFSIK